MSRMESSSDLDGFAQEPFDSEVDFREYLASLHVKGLPLSGVTSDVHAAILVGTYRGHRVVIITFRGTKGLVNIKSDIKANMDRFEDPEGDRWYQQLRGRLPVMPDRIYIKGVKVHMGFQDALASIKEKLISRLVPIVMDGEPADIWCVGHSFGGALATLCSVKVHKLLQLLDPARDRTTLNVFVAGSPRVGDKQFRKFFDELEIGCEQLALEGDLITAMPPAFIGYRRVGRLVQLGESGHIRSNPGLLEHSVLMSIATTCRILLAAIGIAPGLETSHKLANYMSALAKAYEKEASCQKVVSIKDFDQLATGADRACRATQADGLDPSLPNDILMSKYSALPERSDGRWVLDESYFGHPRGAEVELPASAVVCGNRALAPMFGLESVMLRRRFRN